MSPWIYRPATVTDDSGNHTVNICNPTDSDSWTTTHLYVIGNEYGTLTAVFAEHEQSAFDIAADADAIKGLALDAETAKEREEENEGEGIMYLGNASEPYDSEHAWIEEVPTN